MVGFFLLDESIYQDGLKAMDDPQLERAAAIWVWQSQNELRGPWPDTVKRLRIIRAECDHRGKPEIFQRAEKRIFRQTRKALSLSENPTSCLP
jgi:hypothetical protein